MWVWEGGWWVWVGEMCIIDTEFVYDNTNASVCVCVCREGGGGKGRSITCFVTLQK